MIHVWKSRFHRFTRRKWVWVTSLSSSKWTNVTMQTKKQWTSQIRKLSKPILWKFCFPESSVWVWIILYDKNHSIYHTLETLFLFQPCYKINSLQHRVYVIDPAWKNYTHNYFLTLSVSVGNLVINNSIYSNCDGIFC